MPACPLLLLLLLLSSPSAHLEAIVPRLIPQHLQQQHSTRWALGQSSASVDYDLT
jgi:hypothetical protein